MRLRTRLILLVAGTVAVAVSLVTWFVLVSTRRAFESLDDQRTSALVAQFRMEFDRRGAEVVRRVEGIAGSEALLRMTIDAGRPHPDYSQYLDEASAAAGSHGLDFLEIIAPDGTIISSAQWTARFGYKESWVAQDVDWDSEGPFLKLEDTPGGQKLALAAVRCTRAGDRRLFVAGGVGLDAKFLSTLVLPQGMRVLLYRNSGWAFSPHDLIAPGQAPVDAARFEPLVTRVVASGKEGSQTIEWPDGPETLNAIPLRGRESKLLGVLLVGSSRRELAALTRRIGWAGLLIGGAGILIGLAVSYSVASRVTRPVERLAEAARAVAGGDWAARVPAGGSAEVGQLAAAFNTMTRELAGQRDRLVQAERVAAWRELARRLAHELKNPLFPLQITVENLRRARSQAPEQFGEIFEESTATLLAELENLKGIVGRFSNFAKMPQPQLEPVNVNEVLQLALQVYEAQLRAPGRPPIEARLELAPDPGLIQADPELLNRAFQNLFLNAIDAMPDGGILTVRSHRGGGGVHIEIADTGAGLTPEECERLFTPYYTTKRHGTGLGLAIVQSVVSDHAGKIWVESAPGRGATFHLEFG